MCFWDVTYLFFNADKISFTLFRHSLEHFYATVQNDNLEQVQPNKIQQMLEKIKIETTGCF